MTVADKAARANTMGVAGLAREDFKRTKAGDHTSQLLRDNDLTMTARCGLEGIHFWPVGLEGDGVPTLSFEKFF